ncbi:MAG: hypothetical protein NTZ59_10925 [Bacteroidetes bacterium]|jgi:hypothetical protein|nr:hypothetical protein [Bacteroidota bacterium]
MLDLVGYIASIFLAISLVVNGAFKFRTINMLGQITFIIYGLLINAFPIIIANSVLLCINVYQLVKLMKSNEQFQYIAIQQHDKIVEQFLKFYEKDIKLFFPKFQYQPILQQHISFVVLRDASIANIFIATIDSRGNATVQINYTVPQYRDYKVGRFIFEQEKKYLTSNSIQQVVYTEVANKNHIEFLKVMGFEVSTIDGKTHWCKKI